MAPTPLPAAEAAIPRLDPELRARWISEFRKELERLLDVWFPRVIDEVHGGFLCDFDDRWRPTGPHRKMLEFQARQTRVAAVAAAFFPDRRHLRIAADHGFAFLRDRMWDRESGGFFRMLDRAGEPLEEGTKHGHGTAYALCACVAHQRLPGSSEALALARETFEWLERSLHDPRHGGYFGYCHRDGRPILTTADSIAQYPASDPIGTPIGFKDVNTTTDLMEALAELASVRRDPVVLDRLLELLTIVRTRIVVAPGSAHSFLHPDWTPVPDVAHYGHNLRAAQLLLTAADPLGAAELERSRSTAQTMIDCALNNAWDPRVGGFAYAGSTFGPIHLEQEVMYIGTKYWWPQAEGLVALVHLAMTEPERYAHRAATLWEYIKNYVVDPRYGGWSRCGRDAGTRARKLPKANLWKDASHEVLALMKCLRILDPDMAETGR